MLLPGVADRGEFTVDDPSQLAAAGYLLLWKNRFRHMGLALVIVHSPNARELSPCDLS